MQYVGEVNEIESRLVIRGVVDAETEKSTEEG